MPIVTSLTYNYPFIPFLPVYLLRLSYSPVNAVVIFLSSSSSFYSSVFIIFFILKSLTLFLHIFIAFFPLSLSRHQSLSSYLPIFLISLKSSLLISFPFVSLSIFTFISIKLFTSSLRSFPYLYLVISSYFHVFFCFSFLSHVISCFSRHL